MAADLSGHRDPDQFIIRAAEQYEALILQRTPTLDEWQSALANVRTDFWVLNTITPATFARASLPRLRRAKAPSGGLEASLLGFKELVEQQQRQEFGQPPREDIGRALLLTFLTAKGFKARKEVISGSGRTDILCLQEGDVIETKVLRSRAQYSDGLDELCEYLDSERKDLGFYVVFGDKHLESHARILGEAFDPFSLTRSSKQIRVIPVNISRMRPSELGSSRRRKSKSLEP